MVNQLVHFKRFHGNICMDSMICRADTHLVNDKLQIYTSPFFLCNANGTQNPDSKKIKIIYKY